MPALIFLGGIDVVDLFELHTAWPGAGGGAVIAVKCLNSVNNCRLRCLREFPQ